MNSFSAASPSVGTIATTGRFRCVASEPYGINEAARLAAGTGCSREDEHLGGCLRANAVDHSDTEGSSRRVVREGIIG
jgi:hypothetical protein